MSKKLLFSLFVFFFFVLQAQGKYKLNPDETKVGFEVSKFIFVAVTGEFKEFEASIEYDTEKDQLSKIQARIDATSVDTGDAERDESLRGEEFFDVSNHPEILFESNDIEKNGTDYVVRGNLTIRGITKPITILGSETGRTEKAFRFRGAGEIDREEYGVAGSSLIVRNKVEFIIRAQVVRE